MRILTILLLLLSLFTYGQENNSAPPVINFEKNNSFKYLDNFFNERNEHFTKDERHYSGMGATTDIRYQIIDSFYVKQIVFKSYYNDDFLFHTYNLIINNDSILYCDIIRRYKSVDSLIYHFDIENKLIQLDNTYLSNFNVEVNHSDFFEGKYTYSSSCGLEGKSNASSIEFKNAVKQKNISKLNQWLSSPNLALQIYAIDGFHQLHKAGYELTKKQKQIIEIIKNRNGELWVCFGCQIEYETIYNLTQEFKFN